MRTSELLSKLAVRFQESPKLYLSDSDFEDLAKNVDTYNKLGENTGSNDKMKVGNLEIHKVK